MPRTTWFFESSSSTKVYQTIKDEQGAGNVRTSCDCPGWTRRAGPNNERDCKHVRMVAAGLADEQCIRRLPALDIEQAPFKPGTKLGPVDNERLADSERERKDRAPAPRRPVAANTFDDVMRAAREKGRRDLKKAAPPVPAPGRPTRAFKFDDE